tara:strand:- start:562 stop:846 length:285 start_codon:yes stop_codon:yes gene_type:complete
MGASLEWFYIQQWAKKKWSCVGKEFVFAEAQRLFNSISSGFDDHFCQPLALLKKGESGMVISNKEDKKSEWEVVVCNSAFLKNNETQRISNEQI